MRKTVCNGPPRVQSGNSQGTANSCTCAKKSFHLILWNNWAAVRIEGTAPCYKPFKGEKMLEKLTWSQVLLPLMIALAIYYGWALSSLYGKRFLGRSKRGNGFSSLQRESRDILHIGSRESSEDGPGSDHELSEEFLEQLRLYLVPYRNSEGRPEIQWDSLRDLLEKFNPTKDWARHGSLIEALLVELANFGVQVPESTVRERIGQL